MSGKQRTIAAAVLLGVGAWAAAQPAPPTATAAVTGATAGAIRLSLADAIARGVAHNLASLLADARVRAAAGQSSAARSSLLPHVALGAAGAREKISLEAYGFPVAPGESPLLGPFNVIDGRVYLSQPLLDLASLSRARAAASSARAAVLDADDVRDEVVAGCAGLYLAVVAQESRVSAARAQLATAKALQERAVDMRNAGTVPAIDALRAEVQLAGERQRVIVAENDLAKARLALARAIGLPLDTAFELTDRVAFAAMPSADLATALAEARASNPALKAAEAELEAADRALVAARREALPVLRLDADYGRIGPTTPTLEGTYSLVASLRVPLFAGGGVRAGTAVAQARRDAARARFDDARQAVELAVRSALLDLRAAADRVGVAREAVDVADAELTQARDRFTAGVVSNLEVVQAQESVATSSENMIAAEFAYNLARIALARAEGVATRDVPSLAGGAH